MAKPTPKPQVRPAPKGRGTMSICPDCGKACAGGKCMQCGDC